MWQFPFKSTWLDKDCAYALKIISQLAENIKIAVSFKHFKRPSDKFWIIDTKGYEPRRCKIRDFLCKHSDPMKAMQMLLSEEEGKMACFFVFVFLSQIKPFPQLGTAAK